MNYFLRNIEGGPQSDRMKKYLVGKTLGEPKSTNHIVSDADLKAMGMIGVYSEQRVFVAHITSRDAPSSRPAIPSSAYCETLCGLMNDGDTEYWPVSVGDTLSDVLDALAGWKPSNGQEPVCCPDCEAVIRRHSHRVPAHDEKKRK